MDKHEALRDAKNHMEGVLNQRFNYMLVLVGLVFATLPGVEDNPAWLLALLTAASILSVLFYLLIGRASLRLRISVDKLREECPDDPSAQIEKEANKRGGLFGRSMAFLIRGIAFSVTLALLAGTLYGYVYYIFFDKG